MSTLKQFTGSVNNVGNYSITITSDGKLQLAFEIDLLTDLGVLLKVEAAPDTWYAKVYAAVKAFLPIAGV